MRLCSKLPAFVWGLAGVFGSALALGQGTGRVVLVLPFENRSGNPSLNWIGESVPDTLDQRLNSAGFLTLSRDDRAFAYDHLGLPAGFRPSRATTIRIAQQLDANVVVVGSFSVSSDHITVQAQVLSVEDLRLSAPVSESAELGKLFDAENAVAWKVARVMDPQFPVAESTFLGAPGAVPLPAFEDYIRGVNAPVPAERLQRLQQAVKFVPDYGAALLALGKEQYAQRDFAAAAATLGKVPPASPLALEAGFFLGLARFNSTNYAGAEAAWTAVAAKLPLPEVVNNEGVAQARQGKDAVALLGRASAADPSEEDYHYNLAIAFFRRGGTADAQREVEAALKLRPGDNEALALDRALRAAAPGTKLEASQSTGFSPVERIRRTFSETSYRQAAFQLRQLQTARLAALPPAQRAQEYTAMGQSALDQGFLPDAEADFLAALQADGHNAAAHAGLATVREQSGRAAEARTEAQASLRLQPNAAALLVLTRLDLADNSLALAASDVSQALQLEPGNATAKGLRQTIEGRGQTVR